MSGFTVVILIVGHIFRDRRPHFLKTTAINENFGMIRVANVGRLGRVVEHILKYET